jgi:tetratricopeptide (TPR) repeat protein
MHNFSPSVLVSEMRFKKLFRSISSFPFLSCGNTWVQRLKITLVLVFCLIPSVFQSNAHPELDAQVIAITAQIKEQPTNAELYLSRAEVHRLDEEYDLALADIQTAARLKPGWSTPLWVRAKALFDANRIEEAHSAIEDFLKAEPGHANGLLLRARSYLKLGQREQTIADFSAALKAFAQPNPELYIERARLQAFMGRFDDAIRGLDEGYKRFATPTLQLATIELERQAGNFNAALRRTDQLIENVRQPATLLLKARLFEQAGRFNEAQNAFQDVLIETDKTAVRLTETLIAIRAEAREGLTRVNAKLSKSPSQTLFIRQKTKN